MCAHYYAELTDEQPPKLVQRCRNEPDYTGALARVCHHWWLENDYKAGHRSCPRPGGARPSMLRAAPRNPTRLSWRFLLPQSRRTIAQIPLLLPIRLSTSPVTSWKAAALSITGSARMCWPSPAGASADPALAKVLALIEKRMPQLPDLLCQEFRRHFDTAYARLSESRQPDSPARNRSSKSLSEPPRSR